MYRTVMRSKIHRARVTDANLNYVGSITIDEDIMDAVNIAPNEKVQIVNNNNGARWKHMSFRVNAAPDRFALMVRQHASFKKETLSSLLHTVSFPKKNYEVINPLLPLWMKTTALLN